MAPMMMVVPPPQVQGKSRIVEMSKPAFVLLLFNNSIHFAGRGQNELAESIFRAGVFNFRMLLSPEEQDIISIRRQEAALLVMPNGYEDNN